jgi:hypothetical protein
MGNSHGLTIDETGIVSILPPQTGDGIRKSFFLALAISPI